MHSSDLAPCANCFRPIHRADTVWLVPYAYAPQAPAAMCCTPECAQDLRERMRAASGLGPVDAIPVPRGDYPPPAWVWALRCIPGVRVAIVGTLDHAGRELPRQARVSVFGIPFLSCKV